MAATTKMTREQTRAFNARVCDQLESPLTTKQAADAINDFIRTTIREDGFERKIMNPTDIDRTDLDRRVDTDKPSKIVDKEPGSPGAVSIPFGTLPTSVYIRGPRIMVTFDRIVGPRWLKDVDELLTWEMDIRQVLSDHALKDILAEEDSKFISAVNTCLVGVGSTVPTSGTVQWQQISGGITRETWEESRKIMPKTPSHLEATTALLNNVTVKEFEKWGRDEMGGDYSEQVLKQGWGEATLSGVKLIVTIKRGLVPDDSMYHFADPKFIGKSYILEETTLWVKREFYLLEWFPYETRGGAIGHTSGVTRADFI